MQWPEAAYTTLNEAQLKAVMHGLSEEFTVIQGPPGTGKTYVGLQLANILLVNKRLWKNEGKRTIGHLREGNISRNSMICASNSH